MRYLMVLALAATIASTLGAQFGSTGSGGGQTGGTGGTVGSAHKPYAEVTYLHAAAGRIQIGHMSTVTIQHGDSVASLGFEVTARDADGDNVQLAAAFGGAGATGMLEQEWESASAPIPYTLTPTSGLFDASAGQTVTVTITANDRYWTNPLTFVINQLPPPPNAPPVITVHESSTGSPLALTHGGVLNVPFGSRLMDLSITLQVTDANGDNVSLSPTLLGDAGLLSDEWQSAARPAPFTLMPVAGLFDDPLGATHQITLVAHDGTDQSVFVLEIRQQPRPSVTGTRTGSGAGCAAHAGTTAWAVLLAAGVILLGRRRRRAA